MTDEARYIRETFPDKKDTIDILVTEDSEFLTLCEDHDACVDAWWYWVKSEEPEAQTRVNEYRAVVRELQAEIAQALILLKYPRPD